MIVPGSVVCFPEERMEFLRMCQDEAKGPKAEPQAVNRYHERFRQAVDHAGSLLALQQLETLDPPNVEAGKLLRRRIEEFEAAAARVALKVKQAGHGKPGKGWREPPGLVRA